MPEGVYLAEDDLLLGGEEGVEVLLCQAGEGFTQRLLQLFLSSPCTGYFKRCLGFSRSGSRPGFNNERKK
jgi:hypothetical protein